MVRQLERSPHTPDGLFTCYPIGDSAHTTVVKATDRHQSLIHSQPNLKCNGGSVFQQSCGHGNWKWTWAPCDKWSCEPCHRRRIRTEITPEIILALALAKERGETLKFITLTAKDGYLGGEPTKEGAKRRRLDFQHLAQWIRRAGGTFEYLKVAELTRRGRVHTHALAIMPYINQKALSAYWKKLTGGSYIVDIEAVGMRCPNCWPGRKAPRWRRKRSMIIPPPGKGSCQNCGCQPDDYTEVARDAALEAGKYLGKAIDQDTTGEDDGGVVKRVKNLTRSKGWPKFVREKKAGKVCEECRVAHQTTFFGTVEKLAEEYPGLPDEMREVALHPSDGAPCRCWTDAVWVESKPIEIGSRGAGEGPSPWSGPSGSSLATPN